MARALSVVAFIAFVGFTSAVPSTYPAILVPEHRQLRPVQAVEQIPFNNYEYSIVPANEYSVAEYVDPSESSLWDYIPLPNPITAIATVASKAAIVGKVLLVNGGFIFLGMALVIGFCAFTPYCTLVIEKPFARQIRSLNIPYLDDVEYYFRQAYDKYHDL
ncbi:hypothetical protein ABMA27_001560 [Loxostege sticticalis]|uniref:Transmembrane protein n=1 Tax=Loxostege sticticalis TaxID=481309 RepID=A0ABR3HYX2_LOXSC